MTGAVGDAQIDVMAKASGGYLERSEAPLASLVLLLPLIIAYEVGTQFFTSAAQHGHDQQIIAFTLLQQFFHFFGASGRHLPALAVVVVLLTWHIARKDPWRVEVGTLICMAIESLTMAVPLLLFGYVLARYFPLAASSRGSADQLIMSFGAGVYEEFFFRLAIFTVLSLLLRDLLKINRAPANLLIVVISAILFSAYHYLSPVEHFVWRTALFRTIAGIFFGLLFIARGFGITAASHCSYDIIAAMM
jgi:hypothetical protein